MISRISGAWRVDFEGGIGNGYAIVVVNDGRLVGIGNGGVSMSGRLWRAGIGVPGWLFSLEAALPPDGMTPVQTKRPLRPISMFAITGKLQEAFSGTWTEVETTVGSPVRVLFSPLIPTS